MARPKIKETDSKYIIHSIRIEHELKKVLVELSQEDMRSFNAQVQFLLKTHPSVAKKLEKTKKD